MTRFYAILLISLAAGCGEVTLSALTTAPPGKVAHLDDDDDTIDLSRGIALGFECNSSEDSYYGPCREATATVDDDTVASVYASYLDSLAESYNGGVAGPRGRTAFVVVGLHAGKTDLHVSSKDGDVTVAVTVFEP
jgi:hypothetical protein